MLLWLSVMASSFPTALSCSSGSAPGSTVRSSSASRCSRPATRSANLAVAGPRLFVRDPNGQLGDPALATGSASLDTVPEGAEDAGYRLGDIALWNRREDDAIYVVTPDGVERWPRWQSGQLCT